MTIRHEKNGCLNVLRFLKDDVELSPDEIFETYFSWLFLLYIYYFLCYRLAKKK